MDKRLLTICMVTWVMSVVMTVILVKSCVKPPEKNELKPDDSKFKNQEDSINKIKKLSQDTIDKHNKAISTKTLAIDFNHKKLENELKDIGFYTDYNKLIDSLYDAARHN